MWRYVVRNVKWGAMRDVVRFVMWPVWCDLKPYGIAKWNSVLREVLV